MQIRKPLLKLQELGIFRLGELLNIKGKRLLSAQNIARIVTLLHLRTLVGGVQLRNLEPTGEGTHNKSATLALLAHHKTTSNPTTPHFSVYTMASESFWACMYWR